MFVAFFFSFRFFLFFIKRISSLLLTQKMKFRRYDRERLIEKDEENREKSKVK